MPNKKDPAFLFYSTAFYEGTRMMFPEERACFIDLLIYQHQNGVIPLDIRKLMMYCGGVSQATLEATLEAKFKRTDQGYINLKLCEVIEDRCEYTKTQSKNGVIGQFYKKAKATLKAQEYKDLKSYIYANYSKDELIDLLEKNNLNYENTLEGLLEASLQHIIKDTIKDKITDSIKNTNTELINTSGEKKLKNFNCSESELPSPLWDRWIKFKYDEFKYKFKSDDSENMAKTKLYKLSGGDPVKAQQIVEQSIENGWKGLFELKNNVPKNTTGSKVDNTIENGKLAADFLKKKYAQEDSQNNANEGEIKLIE